MSMHAQGKVQKRPEKIFSLHLKLILGTETSYNYQKNKTNKLKQYQNTASSKEGGESDFQSYHIITFQCLVFNKKSQGIEEREWQRKQEVSKRKK